VGYVYYQEVLDHEPETIMCVEFETQGPLVLGYSVVLLIDDGQTETVRLYDAAHRFNELHRFTRRDGKQPGISFHRGTLGEGMRTAIERIKKDFQQMIEGWERG